MRLLPAYRFATDDHWAKGLSAGIGTSRLLGQNDGSEVPGVPREVALLAAGRGEIWFIDDAGHLRVGDVRGPVIANPIALVVGRSRVWVLTTDALLQFDRRTCQSLLEMSCAAALAMTGDGKDGVWLLRQAAPVDRKERREAVHVTADGRLSSSPIALADSVTHIANVSDTLLALDGQRIDRITGRTWSLPIRDALAGGRPGWLNFTADRIVPGPSFALVSGVWNNNEPGAILVDAAGAVVGLVKWQDRNAPRAIALDGSDVLVLFDSLRRYSRLYGGGVVKLTPALIPEQLSGNWLRAEVDARLPVGATLTLRWAAVTDPSIVQAAGGNITGSDPSTPVALRIAAVARMLWGSSKKAASYQGLEQPDGGPVPVERFSFALHDAEPGTTLFVELKLETDGAAPELLGLSVIHDTEGLMGHLPAIYRGDGDGDGTMRRIVGVLETTTHGIDDAINRLHTRLDPERTDAARLPALAAMLGLPFDEALPVAWQRQVVGAGPHILAARGTRAGLAALLQALFPGRPWKIVDRTAGLLATTLSSTTLPGLLLGPSARLPKLNARLTLNKTRLRCAGAGEDDGLVRTRAEIAVTIPATFEERRMYSAALRQMLTALLPAGLTLRLSWSPWRNGMPEAGPDVLTTVDSPEDLKLGEGQSLGAARVGGRRNPKIPPDGFVPIGHRLL